MKIPNEVLADPWFHYCLSECVKASAMVSNFSRLSGIPTPSSGGINRLVDEASGLDEKWAEAFAEFVYRTVYLRVKRPAGGVLL